MRPILYFSAGVLASVAGGFLALGAVPASTPAGATHANERRLINEVFATRGDNWRLRQENVELLGDKGRLMLELDTLRRAGQSLPPSAGAVPGVIEVSPADLIPPQNLPIPSRPSPIPGPSR